MTQQKLKTQKTWKSMQKKIILFLSVLYIIHFLIPNVSAMYYHQSIYPDLIDNHTIRYYAYIVHPRTDTILTDRLDTNTAQNPFIPMFIFDLNAQLNYFQQQYSISTEDINAWNYGDSSDKYPYQFYIKYDLYPYSANSYVNYTMIQYCQINITKSKFASVLEGISTTPIQQLLFKRIIEADLYNQEYYIELERGDTAYIKIDCYYTNSEDRSLVVPVNLYVITPTYSCSKCNAYEWSKLQPILAKADFLLEANTNNVEYIKKIIFINYEFIVIIYWFILILLVVFSVGLIFLIGYWLYLWLAKMIK
jgi:hypothetical protein